MHLGYPGWARACSSLFPHLTLLWISPLSTQRVTAKHLVYHPVEPAYPSTFASLLTLTTASRVLILQIAPTRIFLKQHFLFPVPSPDLAQALMVENLQWLFHCLEGLNSSLLFKCFRLVLSSRSRLQATNVSHTEKAEKVK